MTGKNKRDVSLLARQTGMEDHGETEECHVMTRQSGRRHHIQQRRERKGKYFRATTIDSLLSVERGGIKKEKKNENVCLFMNSYRRSNRLHLKTHLARPFFFRLLIVNRVKCVPCL